MEDPLPEYGGHHNLLTHPLRHVTWENWINFSEHKIVTFSRELVFIDHCITLISYNLGNYLFQVICTQSFGFIFPLVDLIICRFFFPFETISTEPIFWSRKTERLFGMSFFENNIKVEYSPTPLKGVNLKNTLIYCFFKLIC